MRKVLGAMGWLAKAWCKLVARVALIFWWG